MAIKYLTDIDVIGTIDASENITAPSFQGDWLTYDNSDAINWNLAYSWGDHSLEGYENTDNKNQNGGYAGLDGAGKIPTSLLPDLAITETFVVNSGANMLALSAQTGDVAVRTDVNETYILAGSDPTVLADWQKMLTPTDAVNTVNGLVGNVQLDLSFSNGDLSLTGSSTTIDLDARYQLNTYTEVSDLDDVLQRGNISTEGATFGSVVKVVTDTGIQANSADTSSNVIMLLDSSSHGDLGGLGIKTGDNNGDESAIYVLNHADSVVFKVNALTGNVVAASYDGDGSLLTDVNATTLDGLDSTDFLKVANDLSDLNDVPTALTNLGLGLDTILNLGNTSSLDATIGQLTATDGLDVSASGTEPLSLSRSGSADLILSASGSGNIDISHSGSGSILQDATTFRGDVDVDTNLDVKGTGTFGGNVGIGTTSPNYSLDVNGIVRLESSNTLRFGGTGLNDAPWFIQQNNGNLNFAEYAVSDGRLYLEAGGKVGINNTNPSEALDVTGNIKATGDIIATNGSESATLYEGGVKFNRNSSYLIPSTHGNKHLYIGGFSDNDADWSSINLRASGNVEINDEIIATQPWVESKGYLSSSNFYDNFRFEQSETYTKPASTARSWVKIAELVSVTHNQEIWVVTVGDNTYSFDKISITGAGYSFGAKIKVELGTKYNGSKLIGVYADQSSSGVISVWIKLEASTSTNTITTYGSSSLVPITGETTTEPSWTSLKAKVDFEANTDRVKYNTIFSEGIRVDKNIDTSGDINITEDFKKLYLDGKQTSAKKYSISNHVNGVTNTGFSIRNETNSTNPFFIDGSDNSWFINNINAGGNVNAQVVNVKGSNNGLWLYDRVNADDSFRFISSANALKLTSRINSPFAEKEIFSASNSTGDITFSNRVGIGEDITNDSQLTVANKNGALQMRVGSISSSASNGIHSTIRFQGRSSDGSVTNYADIKLDTDTGKLVFNDPGVNSSSIGQYPMSLDSGGNLKVTGTITGSSSATFGGKVVVNHGATSGALDLTSTNRYSGITFTDNLSSGVLQFDGTTDRFNLTKDLNVSGKINTTGTITSSNNFSLLDSSTQVALIDTSDGNGGYIILIDSTGTQQAILRGYSIGGAQLDLDAGGITAAGDIDITGTFTGNGSGLSNVNAATLDGIDSSQFLRRDQNNTYSSTDFRIQANTADGSDTKRMIIAGGGSASTSRGAYVSVHGNEFSSGGGNINLVAGSAGEIKAIGNLDVSGDSTIDGRITASYEGDVSANGAYNIIRTFDSSRDAVSGVGSGNARGIYDNTIWDNNSNDLAYAGYDNKVTFDGGSYDHFTGVQIRPVIINGASISELEGVYAYGDSMTGSSSVGTYIGYVADKPFTFDNSTITNFIGYDVRLGAGTNGASVTNFYGLRIDSSINATNKWGIYSTDANVDSRHDGEFRVGELRTNTNIYSANTSMVINVNGKDSSTNLDMDSASNEATFNNLEVVADGYSTSNGSKVQLKGEFELNSDATTSHTLVNTDKGEVREFTSSFAVTLTINTTSLTSVGDIAYIDQMGTGEVTISAGAGVSLLYNSGKVNTTSGQYSRVAIHKVTSTNYRIFGELKSA